MCRTLYIKQMNTYLGFRSRFCTKFIPSSKMCFLLNILLSVGKKQRRKNGRRKGRCKHSVGYKEDHEVRKMRAEMIILVTSVILKD